MPATNSVSTLKVYLITIHDLPSQAVLYFVLYKKKLPRSGVTSSYIMVSVTLIQYQVPLRIRHFARYDLINKTEAGSLNFFGSRCFLCSVRCSVVVFTNFFLGNCSVVYCCCNSNVSVRFDPFGGKFECKNRVIPVESRSFRRQRLVVWYFWIQLRVDRSPLGKSIFSGSGTRRSAWGSLFSDAPPARRKRYSVNSPARRRGEARSRCRCHVNEHLSWNSCYATVDLGKSSPAIHDAARRST